MFCAQQATYAEDLLAKEKNWHSKLPGNAFIVETISLRLHHHHAELQEQRVSAERLLIQEYELQPLHCFKSSPTDPSALILPP
jgi:hypothetical protein